MRVFFLVVSILLLTGCASVFDVKDKYYVCYYGEKKKELCESTVVPEDDERACVDLADDFEFSEGDCNKKIGQSKLHFF
ncbi:MAG: hypothetical protein V7739_05915 [Motiliproteus sp.]